MCVCIYYSFFIFFFEFFSVPARRKQSSSRSLSRHFDSWMAPDVVLLARIRRGRAPKIVVYTAPDAHVSPLGCLPRVATRVAIRDIIITWKYQLGRAAARHVYTYPPNGGIPTILPDGPNVREIPNFVTPTPTYIKLSCTQSNVCNSLSITASFPYRLITCYSILITLALQTHWKRRWWQFFYLK